MNSKLPIVLALVVLCGCDGALERSDRQRRRAETASTQLSLDNIVEDFNQLHEAVNLEMAPPRVIVDARLTGQEVTATFGPSPFTENSDGSNLLTVVSGGVPLKRAGVQSGDRIEYFIRQDEFSGGLDIAAYKSVQMTVAQVLDDEHIQVEGNWKIPDPASGQMVPMTVPDPARGLDQPMRIEIWRSDDQRFRDIDNWLAGYALGKAPVTALGWQPSPDEASLEQALNRLNQWMRTTHEDEVVKEPAILKTLPEGLLASKYLAPMISRASFSKTSFNDHEGRFMQEAVWMRNISNWTRGDAVQDVQLATNLFDWTVRHIQLLESVPWDATTRPHYLARYPWEIALFGEGTAQQRAWVFNRLCRQVGLPVIMLGVPDDQKNVEIVFWCAAVLSDDKLYLFDCELGLPIPGPDRQGVATLDQAADDPSVLRQLDLSPENAYPFTADKVQQVVAMLEATPFGLSRRTALLQKELKGQSGFVIESPAPSLADSITQMDHIGKAMLWEHPWQTINYKQQVFAMRDRYQPQRTQLAKDFSVFAFIPTLWNARVMHFRGAYTKSTRSLLGDGHGGGTESIDGHTEAIRYYLQVRDEAIRQVRQIGKNTLPASLQTALVQAHQGATYWLGLLKLDQAEPDIAIASWLQPLVAEQPRSPWLSGAKFNMARALESLGQQDRAIEFYESSESPQRQGDRLRARWLKDARQLTYSRR